MNSEEKTHSVISIDSFSFFFEELKEFLLSNIKNSDMRTVYPFGKDSDEIIGRRCSFSNIYYDIDYLFDIKSCRDDKKYATREKIYLEEDSFFLKHSFPNFSKLEKLYKFGKDTLNKHEIIEKLLKEKITFSDQLMLIKYSVSDKLSETEKEHFHKLGSKRFGTPHQDDTILSVHLGESQERLKLWDYEELSWIKANFKRSESLFLMGKFSQLFNYKPTFHRLSSNETKKKSKDRYSFILERVHTQEDQIINLSTKYDNDTPNIYDNTALIVSTVFEETSHDKELYKLTINYLNNCLPDKYRNLINNIKIINLIDYQDSLFEYLENKNYKRAIIIPLGLLITSDCYIKKLLHEANKNPDVFFTYYPTHFEEVFGLFVCNILKKSGKCLDKLFREYKFPSCLPHVPSLFIEDFYINFPGENISRLTKNNNFKEILEDKKAKLNLI